MNKDICNWNTVQYTLNFTGRNKSTTTVSIPPELINTQARLCGIPVEKFRKEYIAIANYNSFGTLFYTFKHKES
jgi:hypothetical protein